MSAVAARRCPAAPGLCATAITLRAKTGVDHWDITVRGGTVRVDVTDETVALTGSATLVADVTLI